LAMSPCFKLFNKVNSARIKRMSFQYILLYSLKISQ